MENIVTHKKCSTCNEWKLTSEFNKNKASKDGLRPECRSCMSKKASIYRMSNREKELERLRRYRENNKEKERESKRKWRENNIEKVRERDRKYREDNKEKIRERVSKWFENNREKVIERIRKSRGKWQKNHPDKAKAILHRYRAQKAGNGGSFTGKEWQELCLKYDCRCLRCGEKKKLTADHVIPVAKGGTSNIENIQPLCGSCNSSKGIKEIDYRY